VEQLVPVDLLVQVDQVVRLVRVELQVLGVLEDQVAKVGLLDQME
jgi:hypothetical protein